MAEQHESDGELEPVADALRLALSGTDRAAIQPLLAPDVTWGDCAGADAVLAFVSSAASDGLSAHDLTVEVATDRIVTEFRLGPAGPRVVQAVFVTDGQISEIVDAADRVDALVVRPVGDLGVAASRGWAADRVSPVLPVVDVAGAVDHYRLLGFDVRHYEGDAAYAFASRGSVELHLTQVSDLAPAANASACYLYVDDADAVYAGWRMANVGGRLIAPVDTDYGLREGAHVDPWGNLLRFGSGI